jgi:hypothetical protein
MTKDHDILELHRADVLRRCKAAGIEHTNTPVAQRLPLVGSAPPSPRTPCKHIGEATGQTVKCESCQGNTIIKVKKCAIFGECTEARVINKLPMCETCDSWKPKMSYIFDRVVVVNLKRRPDRLESFRAQLEKHGWPFKEPDVFEAVDGYAVSPPPDWLPRHRGAWGCLQSHRQILERAMADGVKSLLVLEDDLCIRGGVEEFFEKVPGDWDQLMLGGQHMQKPPQVSQGVVRCLNTQRTHAYAVRGRFINDLYATWHTIVTPVHCDHIMGPMQSRYKVYAPEPFLFGQAEGASDVMPGQYNQVQFWDS